MDCVVCTVHFLKVENKSKKSMSGSNISGLTTCGHAKTFSLVIVSTEGPTNAHCFANCTMADTATKTRVF